MMLGPLEYLVVGFEGNNFRGDIAREIARLSESGIIRVVDGDDHQGRRGQTAVLELDNKEDPRFAAFAPLLSGLMGLFTPEDVATIAADIRPNMSALALLFEHRWAVHIKEAMAEAGGFLVGRVTIPPEVLEEVNAELEAAAAPA